MRLVFLVGMPAVVGLILLAEPIILILFERGSFSPEDTLQASYSLVALALGLVAFMLIKILTPSFFARQEPKKPMYVALASMILNGILAWLLGFLFWIRSHWVGHGQFFGCLSLQFSPF